MEALSIIGPHPTSGFRIDLVRASDVAPWHYEGRLATPEHDLRLSVRVALSGEVALTSTLEATLAERVRLLVRQVAKHALTEGQSPPRRIQRWRP